jgi:hypothetical protein
MRWLWPLLLLAGAASVADEEFSFDADQYARRAYELGGHLEAGAEQLRLDRDAALATPGDDAYERYRAVAELSGLYRWEKATLNGLLHAEARDDPAGRSDVATLYELYLAARPSERLGLEVGKRSLRWGKGYAFNPVAFLERPKDATDPELSREGFVMAGAEVVRSFDGPLRTVAFTPVLLPVSADLNDGFGREDDLNVAARLYLLYRDTDIDLMLRRGDSRPDALGLDFARNLATHFELHGEVAWFDGREVAVLRADDTLTTRKAEGPDLLLGLRYLTVAETTWIVEYYRNGAGYTPAEMRRFFDLTRAAADTPVLRAPAMAAREAGYLVPQPMRDYLYLKATQKEPFDALYWSAGATAILNLHDGSASLIPEAVYTGITDLELRGRLALLSGGRDSDFGERPTDWRLELRARWFF